MPDLTEFLLTQCRKIHLADYKTQARIGVVDKLFTRVGASDDLASGTSTFMLRR